MWFSKGPLLTHVLICAVYYLVVFSKATPKGWILTLLLEVDLGFQNNDHIRGKAPQRHPLSGVYPFLLHVRLRSLRHRRHPWCSLDASPYSPDEQSSGVAFPQWVVFVRMSMTLALANQHIVSVGKAETHEEAERLVFWEKELPQGGRRDCC